MIVTIDFETYFDQDYSLKKLPTYAYVRDQRFETLGAAVKIGDHSTSWMTHDEFKQFVDHVLRAEDHVTVIAHNAYFDCMVLNHHYDYVPDFIVDTLSYARALLPYLPSHSLDEISKYLGLGHKHINVLPQIKGKRAHEIGTKEWAILRRYGIQDADLTYQVYEKLLPAMPKDEASLVDLTVRWGAVPVLEVDVERADAALRAAREERSTKIEASGTTEKVLNSQPQFRALVESLGIEVPMKKNPKGQAIPAFGKNDLGFRQLLVDYPEHRALFEGRIAAKSNIAITRTRRIRDLGKTGKMPMPLNYYGAHTGRWSGADYLNVQNLQRGSELRRSIIAPEGYVILVGDLSQIELRMNFWFSGQLDLLRVFAEGGDIYKVSAGKHFGVPVEQITAAQRFFGKTMELGLGYGMGWKKFRYSCALEDIWLSEEEAYVTVAGYRRSHAEVRRMWGTLDNMLHHMNRPDSAVPLGPLTVVHEGIRLPNGLWLDYSGLEPVEDGWIYGTKRVRKIYGAMMLENVVQALARIVLSTQILEAQRRGLQVVSSTHDEMLIVVPEDEADSAERELQEIMTQPPEWCYDLPLDCETGWAREYSK